MKFGRKEKEVFLLLVFMVIALTLLLFNKYETDNSNNVDPVILSKTDMLKYGNNDPHAIVIYPILTQYAYQPNGFYAYYNGTCQTCTTQSLEPFYMRPLYTTGEESVDYLMHLGYGFITDIDVDKNPGILKQYDKIILLHNEYMTQKEFNAIMAHKNVIYLYPNSAYARVSVDYQSMTMTLLEGHNYPKKTNVNGFNFITSSTNEYNTNCKKWEWRKMPNGMELDCFPEHLITYDKNLWMDIRDYPQIHPKYVGVPPKYDMSNFTNYLG